MLVEAWTMDVPQNFTATLNSGGNLPANTEFRFRIASIDVKQNSYISQSGYAHVRSDISDEIIITTTDTEKSITLSWDAVGTSGRTNDVSYLVFVYYNGTWYYIRNVNDNTDYHPTTDQTTLTFSDLSQTSTVTQHTFMYQYETPYGLDKYAGEPTLVYMETAGSTINWDMIVDDIKTYLGNKYVYYDGYTTALKCYVRFYPNNGGTLTINRKKMYFWRTSIRINNFYGYFDTAEMIDCILEHNGYYGYFPIWYWTKFKNNYINFWSSYPNQGLIISNGSERLYMYVDTINTFEKNIVNTAASWIMAKTSANETVYVYDLISKSAVRTNWGQIRKFIEWHGGRIENNGYIYIDGGYPQTYESYGGGGFNRFKVFEVTFDNPDSTKDFYTYAMAYPDNLGYTFQEGFEWAKQYATMRFYDCTFKYGTDNVPRVYLNDLGRYYPYTWAWQVKTYNSLQIKLLDAGGNPIQNGTIEIYDKDNNLLTTMTTDVNGLTSKEYIERAWVYHDENKNQYVELKKPYTIKIVADGFEPLIIKNADIDPKQFWNIKISKEPIVIDAEVLR